jgi:hypothetical protein
MALFRSIGAGLDSDNTGTEPLDTRKDLAGLFSGPGVLAGGAAPLVTGTSGMAYSVGAAQWVTSRGAGDGVHLWGNDGAITVGSGGVGTTVPVAPGSGLSRVDIIYAFHPSNGENSDTTSQPTVAVAVGNPGTPGLAPAIPPGALELARNTMQSSATSTASAGNTIAQTVRRSALKGSTLMHLDPALSSATTINAGAQAGVTQNVVIPAVAYPRVVEGVFGVTAAAGSGAEVQVWKDGSSIRKVKGLSAATGVSGGYKFLLPANTQTALGLVVLAGGSQVVVGTDGQYVYHQVSSSYYAG